MEAHCHWYFWGGKTKVLWPRQVSICVHRNQLQHWVFLVTSQWALLELLHVAPTIHQECLNTRMWCVLLLSVLPFATLPPPLCHTQYTHNIHMTRNQVIISNSLLSSSYAQQLLNFGGNFQKILSVSLSEIACPDAPLKKILNLEKTQNISKGKYWEITRAVSFIQLSVLQRFQGLKC